MKEDIQDYTGTVQLFLESRKTEATKRFYTKGLEVTTQADPANFLKLAKENKLQGEAALIHWVQKNRTGLKHSTLTGYLAGLKSLCDYADVLLNWKKVRSCVPDGASGKDRPPYLKEIRALYQSLTLRDRFGVSYFVSTGARLASIDFLKMKDIEEFPKLGIAAVRIYRGEAEEYFSFLNSEALEDFHNYVDYRKRAGEIIAGESPVFRTSFNHALPKKVKAATSDAVKRVIQVGWEKLGLKEREFAEIHGFRSYFKTQLENESALKTSQIERLMGHGVSKVENRYYKPEVEKLGALYAQNQSCLFISEGMIGRGTIAALEEEKDSKISKLESEVSELKAGLAEILRLRKEELNKTK